LRVDVHQLLLAGPERSRIKLRVRTGDATVREIEMERDRRVESLWDLPPRSTPVYGVLPNGFGYIDLDRLPLQDADRAMDAVWKTRGLIFDMRGCPRGTAWVIAPRLAAKKVVAARFERLQLSGVDLADTGDTDATHFAFTQTVAPNRTKPRYTGRVVM